MTMLARFASVCCLLMLTTTVIAADPGELFAEAERLARDKEHAQAMAKVEEAVAEIERDHLAGREIPWAARNGLRFAAKLAREDFLDYEKSLQFCDKLLELADTDYWRVPARLERALTYRAMQDFERAQIEYDAIAAADKRQRFSALLPRAEMVFFEIGDETLGRRLIMEAMANPDIQGRERFRTLRMCAENAIVHGQPSKAIEWYSMLPELPFQNDEERDRYLSQAWYEMGKISESRGQTAQAKEHYRKAMDLENGEMRYRVRARDALERIEYFE